MICGELAVKWLDAERCGVAVEPLGIHQCDGAQPTDVAIVQRSTVVENELDGRVLALALRKIPGVNQQSAREARLDDQTFARREIEHDELRAPPCSRYPRPDKTLFQRTSIDLPQNVRAADVNGDDGSSCDLAIEVAGDGLGLR